jgi:anti-sigma regulatory factor (Ser/Thr protein kinase)
VSDILLTEGFAGTEAVDPPDSAGALIYERMLLASPGSVSRMRHELIAALARQQVRADRLADIDLVFVEAAHNAVDHAYRRVGPGPLYTAASLADEAVIIWVSDGGRGMYQGSSRGAGLGMPLMSELADDLHISCDAVLGGTCVQATFQRAAYPATRAAVSCEREHAELLHEYLRVLGEVSASLRDDSQAVLAQATQAVAQARSRQLERAHAPATRVQAGRRSS